MQLDFNSEMPIFMQVESQIEDAILSGAFMEETQIPSITEVSVNYKINPATALKGINLLVDAGIIYKKRGIGMFVATGATEKLREKRKEVFFDNYIVNMIDEVKRLNISKQELEDMIERGLRQ